MLRISKRRAIRQAYLGSRRLFYWLILAPFNTKDQMNILLPLPAISGFSQTFKSRQ